MVLHPFFVFINRTKFLSQVYGGRVNVVNAIPLWFLVFSLQG
jgi:hypothetical protein